MACKIKLPPKVDITVVETLREEWMAAVSGQKQVTIDCGAVEIFSAAGAQLMVALSTMVKATGNSLTLKNIPGALKNDFTTLGLEEFLQHG